MLQGTYPVISLSFADVKDTTGLIQIGILIAALANLIYQIYKGKKK